MSDSPAAADPLVPRPAATVMLIRDAHAGGIGLAERLFEVLPDLLRRGLETLGACPCAFGCPSCVGPVNEVGRKAKATARALLRALAG